MENNFKDKLMEFKKLLVTIKIYFERDLLVTLRLLLATNSKLLIDLIAK